MTPPRGAAERQARKGEAMGTQFIEIEFTTAGQLASFIECMTHVGLFAACGAPWNDDRLRALVDAEHETTVKEAAVMCGGVIVGVKEVDGDDFEAIL